MNKGTLGQKYFNMAEQGEKIPPTHREMQLGNDFYAVQPNAIAMEALLRDIVNENIQVKHLVQTSGEVVVYVPRFLGREFVREGGIADRLTEIFQGVIPEDSVVEIRDISEIGGNYDDREYEGDSRRRSYEGPLTTAVKELLGDQEIEMSQAAAVRSEVEGNGRKSKSKTKPKTVETKPAEPVAVKIQSTDDGEVAVRTFSKSDAEQQLNDRPGWIPVRLGQAGHGLIQPSLAGLKRAVELYNPAAMVVQKGDCTSIVLPERHDAASQVHAFGFFKTSFEGKGEIKCIMFVNASDYVEAETITEPATAPAETPKRVRKPRAKKTLVAA